MRCICLFSSSLDICQIKPWQSEQIFLNIAFLHVSKHCAFNCCENTKFSKTEKKENEKVQETATLQKLDANWNIDRSTQYQTTTSSPVGPSLAGERVHVAFFRINPAGPHG